MKKRILDTIIKRKFENMHIVNYFALHHFLNKEKRSKVTTKQSSLLVQVSKHYLHFVEINFLSLKMI